MLTPSQHQAVTTLRADDMQLAANAAARQWNRGYKFDPPPLLPIATRQLIKAANDDLKAPAKLA